MSGKFLQSLRAHVTSSALTLRPNIADQTTLFGVGQGETTSLLIEGVLTCSKYV